MLDPRSIAEIGQSPFLGWIFHNPRQCSTTGPGAFFLAILPPGTDADPPHKTQTIQTCSASSPGYPQSTFAPVWTMFENGWTVLFSKEHILFILFDGPKGCRVSAWGTNARNEV